MNLRPHWYIFQDPKLKHNSIHVLASVFVTWNQCFLCHLPSKRVFSNICLIFIDFMELKGEINYCFEWPLPEMDLWYCSQQRDSGSWMFEFSFIFSGFYYFLNFIRKQGLLCFVFSFSVELPDLPEDTTNPKVQLFSDSLSIDWGHFTCFDSGMNSDKKIYLLGLTCHVD